MYTAQSSSQSDCVAQGWPHTLLRGRIDFESVVPGMLFGAHVGGVRELRLVALKDTVDVCSKGKPQAGNLKVRHPW